MEDVNIKQELTELCDKEYREILLKNYPLKAREVRGIPPAALQELARTYACRPDWRQVVDEVLAEGDSYEVVLLQALITGYALPNEPEVFARIVELLQRADSEQLCDALALALSIARRQPEETLRQIEPLLKSGKGFEQRFAIVVLLDYFITSDYIALVLDLYDSVRPHNEAALHALGWGYTICFGMFPERTFQALKSTQRPVEEQHRIIEDIAKSPRLSPAQCELILSAKKIK